MAVAAGLDGNQMTSRERVLAAVRGLPIDRVPVMTWLNPHAGLRLMTEFQPTSSRLAQRVGSWLWRSYRKKKRSLLSEDVRAFLPLFYSGYVNKEYALDLGSDLVSVGLGITKIGDKIWRQNGRLRVRDAFGSIRGMGSIYLDVIEPAVKSIRDLVELRFPDASGDKTYDAIRKFRAEHPDACLYGESFGVQDLPSTQIWEMSQFMLALYDHPDELRDDILRAYRIGGRNGRHILGYSHMLQYSMPAANLEVILRTVRDVQQGRYDD
jgi:hypothetical protein